MRMIFDKREGKGEKPRRIERAEKLERSRKRRFKNRMHTQHAGTGYWG